MDRQDTFEDFDWKVERSAFIKALPKIFARALGTAAAFTALFVSLLLVLTTRF